MTRSRDTADTQDNLGGAVAPFVAGKNGVINGGFDIWQRGTSVTLNTTNYLADRWVGYNAAGASTATRQATNDTTNLPSIQYCMRIQRTAGNASTNSINTAQSFESVNSIQYAGKTVTLSFYARAGANYSGASNALQVYLATGTGTDQSAISGFTNNIYVINTPATLTTTWQRFTYTAAVASNRTQVAPYFVHVPVGTAGAADYFEITGVQLELGSVATPFARAGGSIGGELALCQRYYYLVSCQAGNPLAGIGYAQSTQVFDSQLNQPVSMRTVPSSIDYSGVRVFSTASGNVSGGTVTLFGSNLNASYIRYTHGSIVFLQDQPGKMQANVNGAYIGLSAEL